MEAKELRIGSLVYIFDDNGKHKLCSIRSINEVFVMLYSIDLQILDIFIEGDVNPIDSQKCINKTLIDKEFAFDKIFAIKIKSLTDRLGYVNVNKTHSNIFQYGGLYDPIEIKEMDDGFYVTTDGGNTYLSEKPFNYIHELQNIHYDLRKTELIIYL